MPRQKFSRKTMEAALRRQNGCCGSCGTMISDLGKAAARRHTYREWAEAHHIWHAQRRGDASLENCVVLCRACHYSAHAGGDYRNKSDWIQGKPGDFPWYWGGKPHALDLD